MNQLYVYIYSLCLGPPPFHPTPISHLVRSSLSSKLTSLCHTAASHQLSISHTVGYICQFQSLSSSSLYPPPHSHTNSLHLCLYSCPENRFIGTIFLDSLHFKSSIYVKVLAVQMNIHLENEEILTSSECTAHVLKKKKKL